MKPPYHFVWAVALATCIHLSAALNIDRINELTGLKGTWSESEKVHKVSQPRNDLPVSVDGWAMPPFMGLTSWAAFSEGGKAEVMVAGDLVLFEDEVNPVMSAALGAGLSVTALHNHFFFDEPRVYFMHLEGQDSVDKLAMAVRKVYDRIKEIRAVNPKPANTFAQKSLGEKSSITAAPLNEIFGLQGEAKDGMVKISIGHKAKMHDFEIGNDIGVNTWAAFAGSDDNAMIDGDFAVEEDQLQTALKSLRRNGFNIVAIHSHMTHETPRILFFHYWGRGPAKKLAEAIQDALVASGLSGVSTEAQR